MSSRTTGPRDVVLDVRRVSKTFPGQRALSDATLRVGRGEVHALMGENGSGKSTLIKILSGYHLPDRGSEILVNGEELPFGSPSSSFRAGLRFVHQHLALVAELNAMENIGLETGFKRPGFIDWQAQEALATELLGRLGLVMDVHRPIRLCSAVEKACVAIARALRGAEADASVVVLDEPTASLYADEVDRLFRVLRELVRRGISVLYVTHRVDEVLKIADRVSVFRDGETVGSYDVAELDHRSLVELLAGPSAVHSPMRRTPTPQSRIWRQRSMLRPSSGCRSC